MIRALTTVGLLMLLLFAATPARADDAAAFGDKGQILVSADRVMGLFDYTSTKLSDNMGNTGSTNYASFALLQNPAGGSIAGNAATPSGVALVAPYNVPRLSFDYTVIPHVTIGGSLVLFFTPGANQTQKSCPPGTGCVTVTQGATSETYYGIAPRGGYIIGLNKFLSFWPRVGVSFYSVHVSTPTNTPGMTPSSDASTYSQFMINLEPVVVFTPASHVGITAGPMVDIPVVGGVHLTSESGGVTTSPSGYGLTLFHIGVELGLLAWF
jgi:hypothetical protein